ncbi:MAG TPA: hypothetical protein VFF04_01810 [Candidatus Babeliales bacterium]|nr:hypothetical protein [Candidatus Babeliales bacterium]
MNLRLKVAGMIIFLCSMTNIAAMDQDTIEKEVNELASKSALSLDRLKEMIIVNGDKTDFCCPVQVLSGTIKCNSAEEAVSKGYRFNQQTFNKYELVLVKRYKGGYSYGMCLGKELHGYQIVQVGPSLAKAAKASTLGKKIIQKD